MPIYEFDGKAPKIASSSFVSDSAVIIGDVTIGEHCYIGPNAVLRADALPIVICSGSAVEDRVVIHVGGPRRSSGCYIGEHVTIGHGAIVHCNKIGNRANVGMGAILSLFSEIGDYSVVAEGSVVKQGQIVPEKVVVGGIPAKILRELEDKDLALWEKSNDIYLELTKKCLEPGVLKRIDT